MKKIYFLCTGNSCRSQIAEGYAKLLLKNQYIYYLCIFYAYKVIDITYIH